MKKIYLFFLLITLPCLTSVGQLANCKGKFLGNIMPSSWSGPVIRSDFATYWNQVTPENAGKWGVAEGSRDNYSWGDLDQMYNFCQQNDFIFKQHVFVWGSQQPSWIGSLSAEEQRQEVEEWYAEFARRYPNTQIIDVVNESLPGHAPDVEFRDALGGFNNGANNPYLAAHPEYGPYGTGWDYIIYSFAKAREYFPDATLLLNDYNIINNRTAINQHLEIVNILKERGLIDGVGIQCHAFSVDNMSAQQIRSNLDLLATPGLPIHVTELDIRGDNNNEQQQRDRYATIFPAFWEHPSVVGITLWGYIEGTTWMDYTGIFNADGSKRQAMLWLEEYMASQPDVCANGEPVVEFTSPADNSAFTSPASITLEATASDDNGSISNVQFYNGNTLLFTDNSAPYSYDWTNVEAGTYELRAVATDNEGNSREDIISIKVNVPQAPYNGTAHPIPGTIQFEEFDLGGNGFAYFDDSPGSETGVNFRTDEDVDIEESTDANGGYNLGWTTAGEWVEYTVNVEAAGTYSLDLRVACNADNRTLSLEMDGTVIAGDVAVPNTAGWQTWTTVTINDVELSAGEQILRITIGAQDYINLNYMTFTAVNVSVPPTVSISSPSSNSNFTMLETITIEATASDEDGSITGVDFYAGENLLGSDNTEPYSFDWSGMEPGTYELTAVATDNDGASTTSAIVTVTIEAVQSPFNGTASKVPGRIEAEEYDLGGEGLGYHEANTNGNEGGATFRNDEVDIEATEDEEGNYNVGYVLQGEWLEYTVDVAATGTYNLDFRVAANGDNKVFHIEVDGENVTGPVNIPNTGGWQTWETVTVNSLNLTAGEQKLRIVFDSDYINLNYFEFRDVITGVNTSDNSGIKIFPNPFTTEGFKINNSGSFTYKIKDLRGSVIESGKGKDGQTIGLNLNTGVYLLIIESNKGTVVNKVVKQ